MPYHSQTKQQINIIHKQLALLNKKTRKTTIDPKAPLYKAQSHSNDYVLINNKKIKRKRIVLLTPACSVATCTMCPLPNEAINKTHQKPTSEEVIQQFESCFVNESLSDYDYLTIYNNGNFFSDSEINPEVRNYIYEQAHKHKISTIVVESLPQFINEEKIKQAKLLLKKTSLTVAIGLQSSNDITREIAINSTCTKPAFEKAINILKKYEYNTEVFLMVKPPFLTEKEAIEDTVQSLKYLEKHKIYEAVLCPTKISPNTIVSLLSEKGYFNPPWLWTLIEILSRINKYNSLIKPRVAISVLDPIKNSGSNCAHNCTSCNNLVLEKLKIYNFSRDPKIFEKIECNCYKDYQNILKTENKKWQKKTIPERVSSFLRILFK